MTECKHCGGQIIGRKRGALYCMSDCADKSARGKYKKKKYKAKESTNICMQCEKEFSYKVRSNYPSPSFCPKCRKKRFIR